MNLTHRARTWTTSRGLGLICVIRGHIYGRHFESLIGPMLARGDMGEVPWCARCGKDAPPA